MADPILKALRRRALAALPPFASRLVPLTTEDRDLDDSDGPSISERPERLETELEHALLLGSKLKSPFAVQGEGEGSYALLLDLDVPAQLLPSSTPGHAHLYVDAFMTKDQHDAVMVALRDAGVIQPGYAESALTSQYGATLRPPWVKKGEDKPLVPPPAPAPALDPLPAELEPAPFV